VTPPVLQIVRRFEVSPERVFDAWLDPTRAALWLFTEPGSERHSMENDPRVGGRWTITDRRGGVDYLARGEYLEIDRPRRLVFSFVMPKFSPEVGRVSVEILADGPGCVMTVTHEGVAPPDRPATRQGWEEMFDQLEAALDKSNG